MNEDGVCSICGKNLDGFGTPYGEDEGASCPLAHGSCIDKKEECRTAFRKKEKPATHCPAPVRCGLVLEEGRA